MQRRPIRQTVSQPEDVPGDGALSRSLAQVPGDLPLDPVQLVLGLSRHDGARERGKLLVSGERPGDVDPERHASNLGGCADIPARDPSPA